MKTIISIFPILLIFVTLCSSSRIERTQHKEDSEGQRIHLRAGTGVSSITSGGGAVRHNAGGAQLHLSLRQAAAVNTAVPSPAPSPLPSPAPSPLPSDWVVVQPSSLPTSISLDKPLSIPLTSPAEDETSATSSTTPTIEAYEYCGFTSSENVASWYGVLFTKSPVLFPKDDIELAHIVRTATENGCKVRVRGAGHTEDGLVMQKLDDDMSVIVVNLKDYTPSDKSWDEVIHTNMDTPSIKMSAGASTLKLMSKIRPRGYLLLSSTAGRFFSLGGVYMNPSVIGSTYNESRLLAQVISVRVMDAFGSIKVYSGGDVIPFRGSLGLLGIITALEIQLRKDTGLRMFRTSYEMNQDHSTEALQSWFNQKLEDNDGTEFFYSVYDDSIDAMSLDYNGNDPFDETKLQEAHDWYTSRLSQMPDLAYTGGHGDQNFLTGIVGTLAGVISTTRDFASLIATTGRDRTHSYFDNAAMMPNDCHFVPEDVVPKFEIISYNIKCFSNCTDEMTKAFMSTRNLLQSFIETNSSPWYPTLPMEWRVFNVKANELTLEHLEVGTYVGVEIVSLMVNDGFDYTYSKFFKNLEDEWRSLFPKGGIHHGKGWGYGQITGYDQGEEFPYQNDTINESIYSDQVRKEFIAKMDEYDPKGTFRAGSGLRMLGLTTKKYTPKQYIGDTCDAEYGSYQCISNCCDISTARGIWFWSSSDSNGICIDSSTKVKDDICKHDCECSINISGNPCRTNGLDRTHKCRD